MKRKKRYILPKTKEPVFDAKEKVSEKVICDSVDYKLTKIFNWYNQNISSEKGHQYFLEFAKENVSAKDYKFLLSMKSYPLSYCWLARQANITKLPKNVQKRLDDKIKNLISEHKNEKQEVKPRKKKISRSKVVENNTLKYLSDLDYELDEFIENEFESEFSMYEYLRINLIKKTYLPKLIKDIEHNKKFFDLALSGKDADIKEAYSNFTKSQLRKIVKFLNDQIKDIDKYNLSLKSKVKKKSFNTRNVYKAVSKMNYKREDSDYDIFSESATKIPGASQLIVFNTKNRLLSIYKTNSVHGLQVSGTSIKNFDVEKSLGKVLRKPEDVLTKFKEGNKLEIRKLFNELTTKSKTLTGRINSDCVLLKVF
jgi:hypothetical protein